ncbi:hypothetical protein RHMOL_Rhmol01G0213200 [Rhododendron molle]|uniref:Uncharacterized protein n=1 Tax=Rhododendron molle TaxID=49168 RepID=A0ACC0Q3I9_RHOML|nr:hypothetical protein RHMOL_Rhmol01G0213200 [Rhododendron molle]
MGGEFLEEALLRRRRSLWRKLVSAEARFVEEALLHWRRVPWRKPHSSRRSTLWRSLAPPGGEILWEEACSSRRWNLVGGGMLLLGEILWAEACTSWVKYCGRRHAPPG